MRPGRGHRIVLAYDDQTASCSPIFAPDALLALVVAVAAALVLAYGIAQLPRLAEVGAPSAPVELTFMQPAQRRTNVNNDYPRSSAWTGWVIFAAAVMLTIGAVDIIQGLAALLKDEVYVVTESGLLVTADFTAWGWSLIFWGVVLILAATALFSGKEWGRWFAIVALVVNGIGQIAWFPAYPLWSLVAIGLGIAVLYALTVGWRDAKAEIRG